MVGRFYFSSILWFTHILRFSIKADVPIVDIVIVVKTDLGTLSSCISSLMRHRPPGIFQRIIFVDNGSEDETIKYENSYCTYDPIHFLCTNITSGTGHAMAINKGILLPQELDLPVSESVLLLSSDTVVTAGWLYDMCKLLHADETGDISIVGPMSNGAIYQSISNFRDPESGVISNSLPIGVDIDELSGALRNFVSSNAISAIPFTVLDGFCYMIKRSLLKKIGLFDITQFHHNEYDIYVDYSMRAFNAGYLSMLAPSVFVYHQQHHHQPLLSSGSSSSKPITQAIDTSRLYINATYGALLQTFEKEISQDEDLRKLLAFGNNFFQTAIQAYPLARNMQNVSILFICAEISSGGGLMSVLQEVMQLRRHGIQAFVTLLGKSDSALQVATTLKSLHNILPETSFSLIREMMILHKGAVDLPTITARFDVLVATSYLTMNIVSNAVQLHPHILSAYYIQDYEVWYAPLTSAASKAAALSYYANNNKTLLFTRSRWLSEMIQLHHDMKVHTVQSGLDHFIYYPDTTILEQREETLSLPASTSASSPRTVVRIIAMVKLHTPRRNPFQTLDLLLRLVYNNNILNNNNNNNNNKFTDKHNGKHHKFDHHRRRLRSNQVPLSDDIHHNGHSDNIFSNIFHSLDKYVRSMNTLNNTLTTATTNDTVTTTNSTVTSAASSSTFSTKKEIDAATINKSLRTPVVDSRSSSSSSSNNNNIMDLHHRLQEELSSIQSEGTTTTTGGGGIDLRVTIYGVTEELLRTTGIMSLVQKMGTAPHRTVKVLQHIEILGAITSRTELAALYRRSDILLDLSRWQVLGRAAMEAIACGVVPILPVLGTGSDLCHDNKYCLTHDGMDIAGFYEKTMNLVRNNAMRYEMSKEGINFVDNYSLTAAAASIANVIHKGLLNYHCHHKECFE